MKTILVLTDLAKNDKVTEKVAAELADQLSCEALLFDAYVVPPASISPTLFPELGENYTVPKGSDIKKIHKEIMDVQKVFNGHNYKGKVIKLKDLNPEDTLTANIRAITRQKDIEMVITGIPGDFVFDSDVKEMLVTLDCPVMFIPVQTQQVNISKIIFSTNLAGHDIKELEWLIGLSKKIKAHLHVCYSLQARGVLSAQEETCINNFVNTAEHLCFKDITFTKLPKHHDVEELEAYATEIQAGIISLQYTRRSAIREAFYGNQTMKLVKHRKYPLIIFPENDVTGFKFLE